MVSLALDHYQKPDTSSVRALCDLMEKSLRCQRHETMLVQKWMHASAFLHQCKLFEINIGLV